MRDILFLTSSARAKGNSRLLAEAAASALPDTCQQSWFDLAALPLPAFADLRPAGLPPDGVMADLHSALMRATDLCVVAPVYWYALPAPAKLLLDHWSGWLDVPELGFFQAMQGKRLWLISTRADPDPTVPDLMEAALRRSGEWLGMIWTGALHGIGDAPGEVLEDRAAMTRAPDFLAWPRA